MAMDGDECYPNVTDMDIDFTLDNTHYVYQGCCWKRSDVVQAMIRCLHRVELVNSNTSANVTQCAQFCGSFPHILPHVYGAFSCVSLLCCLGVFITYYTFPRLQQSGYSSKVFLRRYTIHYLYMYKFVGENDSTRKMLIRDSCVLYYNMTLY